MKASGREHLTVSLLMIGQYQALRENFNRNSHTQFILFKLRNNHDWPGIASSLTVTLQVSGSSSSQSPESPGASPPRTDPPAGPCSASPPTRTTGTGGSSAGRPTPGGRWGRPTRTPG